MDFTRTQLDTLLREELVGELPKCSNTADQLKIFTDRFDDFIGKYDKLQSELVISNNCNSLLFNRIINLERETFSNPQYLRKKILVTNPAPHSINKAEFDEKVCEALSLTRTKVNRENLGAYHRMKKKDKVIIFTCKNGRIWINLEDKPVAVSRIYCTL